jgi:hypothetical protein
MSTLYKVLYTLEYLLIAALVWSMLARGDHSGFECFCGAIMAPYVVLSVIEIMCDQQ